MHGAYPLDFLDKVVHHDVQSYAILEALNGVEEAQFQDVGVGAVGRLVEEPDVPPPSSTHRHDVRVVANIVRSSIVLLDEDVSRPTWPLGLDGREDVVQYLLLAHLLDHLHHRRHHRTRSPVPAVPSSLHLPGEREDSDLTSKYRLWTVSLRGRPTGAQNVTFFACVLCCTLFIGRS